MAATPAPPRSLRIGFTSVHLFAAGSYRSTELQVPPPLALPSWIPPTAYSTPPTTATPTRLRSLHIGPTGVQLSAAGSYRSTEFRLRQSLPIPPTAYSTPSTVATPAKARSLRNEATSVHESVARSYRSTWLTGDGVGA
mmetsp:Transcript_81528/g.244549  ORF Transcript_81528/g.244549 Transcript_81528/m.244549 type:complete len:139 (-) Transcript_81528:1100-1516(-)